jgi:hypothetical protein
MLTQTQLRNAKTGELQRLKRRIEAELQRRREGPDGASSKVLERRDTPGGTYQWEMVECGHKERCKKCKSGKKHGPYLYRYFYKNGKYTSQYIRLKDLDKHPDAPPRPILPHRQSYVSYSHPVTQDKKRRAYLPFWRPIHKVLDQLRGEGYPVNEADLVHLSPTRYTHVNPYGRYRFDLDVGSRDKKLRSPSTI